MDIPTYSKLAQRLKTELDAAAATEDTHGFAYAYGYLRGVVKIAIRDIQADIDATVDDMAAEAECAADGGGGCS